MSIPTPTIRRAIHTDVPLILSMIRELAEYEKDLESCHATEELLSVSLGFAPGKDGVQKAYANTFLMFEEENPVGMALWFYNYSTWTARPGVYLEDLLVRPTFRGKGYGTALLASLAKEVERVDGGRLDWSVLKWNEPSITFYKNSIGAKPMSEWEGMRVEGDGLKKLSAMGPDVKLDL